jgi:hypothetical protein
MVHTTSKTTDMIGIVVTADHVYLPLDEQGNGRADWAATSEATSKVAKRTRLEVPSDLAKFLSNRDQVEILSAPLKAGL